MKGDALRKIRQIANNALYFDDSSDYGTALWEILDIVAPELFSDDDLPELTYDGGETDAHNGD